MKFASIEIVSRWMPKKVSDVAGPSTLDGLIGAIKVCIVSTWHGGFHHKCQN